MRVALDLVRPPPAAHQVPGRTPAPLLGASDRGRLSVQTQLTMCGIAGWAGDIGADAGTLRRMCATIAHRGPDDEGYYVRSGRVGLGFRRLSIIDLTGGSQPLGNETHSIVATCNGEIYNFRDLRRELERDGHQFASQSDTEVIPHLWESHGPECV